MEIKKYYPFVRLNMLLPYHPANRKIKIGKDFDGTYFPEGQEKVPPRLAIIRANEYMVRTVDYLIAYVSHPTSASREIVELALKRQKRGLIQVTNLSGWDLLR